MNIWEQLLQEATALRAKYGFKENRAWLDLACLMEQVIKVLREEHIEPEKIDD